MILFFKGKSNLIAVDTQKEMCNFNLGKLLWLFEQASLIKQESVDGIFVGPRKEMITPWSTNAVEITQNMGISGIERIEEFSITDQENAKYDPMLQRLYKEINQDIFTINKEPEPIRFIENITEYNQQEGLALNNEEIKYLESLSKK